MPFRRRDGPRVAAIYRICCETPVSHRKQAPQYFDILTRVNEIVGEEVKFLRLVFMACPSKD
jgi:predicted secreted protein